MSPLPSRPSRQPRVRVVARVSATVAACPDRSGRLIRPLVRRVHASVPMSPTSTRAAYASRYGAVRAGPARPLDITLFGATGFTGRLVAGLPRAQRAGGHEHRPRRPVRGEARVDPRRAAEVRRRVAARRRRQADAGFAEERSPRRRGSSSRPSARTRRRPRARRGVRRAPAPTTADLTGEVLFMRESIDGFDAVAKESGARIVHTLRVRLDPVRHRRARAAREGARGRRGRARGDDAHGASARSGGPSGGTFDSLLGEIDEAKARQVEARKVARRPVRAQPRPVKEPRPRRRARPRAAVKRDDRARRAGSRRS